MKFAECLLSLYLFDTSEKMLQRCYRDEVLQHTHGTSFGIAKPVLLESFL